MYKFLGDHDTLKRLALEWKERFKTVEVRELVRKYAPEHYDAMMRKFYEGEYHHNTLTSAAELSKHPDFQEISRRFDQFVSSNPAFAQRAGSLVTCEAITAIHLKRTGACDLAVGILNKGAKIPICFHMLGGNTAFLEYHRAIGDKPVWHHLTSRGSAPRGRRWIIFEDDAVTGNTLRAITPLVLEKSPDKVRICFH